MSDDEVASSVAEEEQQSAPAATCPCCGASRQGRFCHECGQDNRHGRLTARALFQRMAHDVTDADSRLWRTLLGLTKNPGRFCREFVDGKRADRFPPFRYMLITTAISLVFVPGPPMEGMENNPDMAAAYDAIMNWLAVLSIPGFFVFAGVMMLTRWASKLNYAEHVAFGLYTLSHFSIIALPAVPLAYTNYWMYSAITMGGLVVYTAWSAAVFYPGNRTLSALAATCGVFVHLMTAMIAGIVLAVGLMIYRNVTGAG